MSVPADQYFSPPEAKFEEPKKGHGCFFYGCIISLVLLVLAIVAVAALIWAGLRFANSYVERFTDTTPMVLPKPDLTEDELKDVHSRVDAFKKALDAGETATLVLTGDEITALINENAEFKNQVAVEIEGDKIKGEISKSLDFFKIPGINTAGRYLNGKATFNVSLANNTLLVTLDELEVKGKPVPDEFMQGIRNENLAKNVKSDPEQARQIQRLESIEVKDGKITLKSRGPEAVSTSEGEATEGEMPAKGESSEGEAKPEAETPAAEPEKAEAKPREDDMPKDEEKPKDEAKPKDEPAPKEEAAPAEEAKPKDEAEPKPESAPADAPKAPELATWFVPPPAVVAASVAPSFASLV